MSKNIQIAIVGIAGLVLGAIIYQVISSSKAPAVIPGRNSGDSPILMAGGSLYFVTDSDRQLVTDPTTMMNLDFGAGGKPTTDRMVSGIDVIDSSGSSTTLVSAITTPTQETVALTYAPGMGHSGNADTITINFTPPAGNPGPCLITISNTDKNNPVGNTPQPAPNLRKDGRNGWHLNNIAVNGTNTASGTCNSGECSVIIHTSPNSMCQ